MFIVFSKLLFEEAVSLVTVGCRGLVEGLGFPREPTPFMRHFPRVLHGSQAPKPTPPRFLNPKP